MSSENPRDPVDGYQIPRHDAVDPWTAPEVLAAAEAQARVDAEQAAHQGHIRMDEVERYQRQVFDGFRNYLTGVGDPARDKSLGGTGGVDFYVKLITGVQAENRWRGSDLGARIIETIPNEMTRRGWITTIQPSPEDERADAAGWLSRALRRIWPFRRGRSDAFPVEAGAPAALPHTPGALPETSDDSTAVLEALDAQHRRLKTRDAFRLALCYERAYGGGAILLGVDDGETDLTRPLDMSKVRSLKYLTVFRGGWDGELVAWRYYRDLTGPRFGEPEIYMLRNIGVPIASPMAPGETRPPIDPIPAGTNGPTIAFVHESRLLVFGGQPVSNWARAAMRGWGDSVFTRVDEVLAQYGQTWNGVAVLMSEYSIPVLKVDGLAGMLSAKNKEGMATLQNRILAMAMSMSVAKMRLLDSKEDLSRLNVPMSGIAEVLRECALRLAAASGQPLSMLMGQTQGGLGDASKGDIRFFYDQVEGMQDDRVQPNAERVTKIIFLSKEGPTSGREPKRWAIRMNPLWQMNDQEKAAYRKTIAETDQIYLNAGVVSQEEVAATRFGGNDFNDGPIVLDVEGRSGMSNLDRPAPQLEPGAPGAQLALPPAPTDALAVAPDTALNGAQVAAMQQIVAAVAERRFPRETGIQIIVASFPVSEAQAEAIMGEVGRTFFVAVAPASAPFGA